MLLVHGRFVNQRHDSTASVQLFLVLLCFSSINSVIMYILWSFKPRKVGHLVKDDVDVGDRLFLGPRMNMMADDLLVEKANSLTRTYLWRKVSRCLLGLNQYATI